MQGNSNIKFTGYVNILINLRLFVMKSFIKWANLRTPDSQATVYVNLPADIVPASLRRHAQTTNVSYLVE